MKKIIYLLACIVTFEQTAMADWSTTWWRNCTITKRYTCRAKLKPPGQLFYSWTYDSGCGYADATISSLAVNNTPNMGDVHTRADNSNHNFRQGWATDPWKWGENMQDLNDYMSIVPKFIPTSVLSGATENNLTANQLNDDGITADDSRHSIDISNLKGFLKITSTDMANNFTTFQINVCRSVQSGDSLVPVDTLWRAKATIIYGNLVLEGNFKADDFVNASSGTTKYYSINGVSKHIVIPDNISLDNITVEVSGDGGNLSDGISRRYAPALTESQSKTSRAKIEKENSLNFILKPEAETTLLQITKNDGRTITGISVIDLSGKLITTIPVSELNNSSADLKTGQLSPGIYYIRISCDNGDYTRKFIK